MCTKKDVLGMKRLVVSCWNGRLECLKYAHEKGCPWDRLTCSAAESGHLECLKYAHEKGCPWDRAGLVLAEMVTSSV